MNIDPSGLESSDQTIIRIADDLSGHVRSYRCTFCKRGFSNAQALGGHMNIHRKDRAKLKQFSDENLLSLDISRNSDSGDHSYPPPPANSSPDAGEKLSSEKAAGSDDKVDEINHNPDRKVPSGLPLFAEAPTASGDSDEKNSRKISKLESMIHGDLDLELRLGPEPHDAKTNSKIA